MSVATYLTHIIPIETYLKHAILVETYLKHAISVALAPVIDIQLSTDFI